MSLNEIRGVIRVWTEEFRRLGAIDWVRPRADIRETAGR